MGEATILVSMARGARVSAVLGSAHAITVLLALREKPGLNQIQLARYTKANTRTIASVIQKFEEYGLVTSRRVPASGGGLDPYHYKLTELGMTLADIQAKAAAVMPDEDDEPEMTDSGEAVLTSQLAQDVLLALGQGDLTFEELQRTVHNDPSLLQRTRIRLESNGLVGITTVTRGGTANVALTLTEKGRKARTRLAQLRAALAETHEDKRAAQTSAGFRVQGERLRAAARERDRRDQQG